MKPYPPSLRERRRYIQFEAYGAAGEGEVSQAIRHSVMSLFGEDGYARSNFSIIRYGKGRGICRCTHSWLDNCLVALALVREAGGRPIRIKAAAVSGTIKGLARKNQGLAPKSF